MPLIYVNETVDRKLRILRDRFANKESDTPASFSKVIKLALNRSNMW